MGAAFAPANTPPESPKASISAADPFAAFDAPAPALSSGFDATFGDFDPRGAAAAIPALSDGFGHFEGSSVSAVPPAAFPTAEYIEANAGLFGASDFPGLYPVRP